MIVLAFRPTDIPLYLIRGMAVIAGALVGAILLSLAMRMLFRIASPQRMPGWGVVLMRVLGGTGGGLAVWLLVANLRFGFGLGTGDGDGDGGYGQNGQKDESKKKPEDKEPVDPNKPDPKKDGKEGEVDKSNTLGVFVLGDKDLRIRLNKKEDQKLTTEEIRHCFWIEGDPPTKLQTLADVQEELRIRRKGNPKLKVYRDVTPNSPDRNHPDNVAPFVQWLLQEDLFIEKPKPNK